MSPKWSLSLSNKKFRRQGSSKAPRIINLTLDRGDWRASRSSHFIPGGKKSLVH